MLHWLCVFQNQASAHIHYHHGVTIFAAIHRRPHSPATDACAVGRAEVPQQLERHRRHEVADVVRSCMYRIAQQCGVSNVSVQAHDGFVQANSCTCMRLVHQLPVTSHARTVPPNAGVVVGACGPAGALAGNRFS